MLARFWVFPFRIAWAIRFLSSKHRIWQCFSNVFSKLRLRSGYVTKTYRCKYRKRPYFLHQLGYQLLDLELCKSCTLVGVEANGERKCRLCSWPLCILSWACCFRKDRERSQLGTWPLQQVEPLDLSVHGRQFLRHSLGVRAVDSQLHHGPWNVLVQALWIKGKLTRWFFQIRLWAIVSYSHGESIVARRWQPKQPWKVRKASYFINMCFCFSSISEEQLMMMQTRPFHFI